MDSATVPSPNVQWQASDEWNFEWITNWDDIRNPTFARAWRRWIDECLDPNPFFEPDAVQAWVDAFQRTAHVEPLFMVARSGHAVAFLPLVTLRFGWKDLWRQVIVPVGYDVFDYHDPITVGMESASAWSTFWSEFEGQLCERFLHRVDYASIYGIRSRCKPEDPYWSQRHSVEIGSSGGLNQNIAPTISLVQFRTIDELLACRSKKLRSDLRRTLHRLEELGPVSYHVHGTGDQAAALRSVADLLAENRKRWPLTWRLRPFYDNLVHQCLPTGFLHLSELRVNDEPVSWHLGFWHKRRLYWYLPAFRADLATYSPGKLHLWMALNEAIGREAILLDFLKGDESYKQAWADGHTEMFGMAWASRRILAQARNQWRGTAKRQLVRLRRRIRNALSTSVA